MTIVEAGPKRQSYTVLSAFAASLMIACCMWAVHKTNLPTRSNPRSHTWGMFEELISHDLQYLLFLFFIGIYSTCSAVFFSDKWARIYSTAVVRQFRLHNLRDGSRLTVDKLVDSIRSRSRKLEVQISKRADEKLFEKIIIIRLDSGEVI